jgi:pilus assembly protein Flp/PilA
MLQFLQRLTNRKDEKGASAVEYGLLVAAIAALIVIIVFALGGVVKDVFQNTCDTIASEASSSQSCGPAAPAAPANP